MENFIVGLPNLDKLSTCIFLPRSSNTYILEAQVRVKEKISLEAYMRSILWKALFFLFQGKAGDSMNINDNNDGAGYPLFTFVDENIFKKETFLGKCTRHCIVIIHVYRTEQP